MNIGWVKKLVQQPNIQVDWVDRIDVGVELYDQYPIPARIPNTIDHLNALLFDLESEISNVQSRKPEEFKNVVIVRSYMDHVKHRIHIIFSKIHENGEMNLLRMESHKITREEYQKFKELLSPLQVSDDLFKSDDDLFASDSDE